MQDALLRTDKGLYFRLRVQFHAVPFLVPRGETLSQLGDADVGLIAVFVGTAGVLAKRFHGPLRGREVGAADT